MIKFILFSFVFLVAVVLIVCVLIFMPFSTPYEQGPDVQYRVEEGAVEVLTLKDNQPQSLLGLVKPGETLTVPPIPKNTVKPPFWAGWIEPATVAAVSRANFYMLKQSKKSRYRDFSVAYTDESIRRGFTKEIEKSQIFSNIRMNFFVDGFSFSGRVGFVPVSVRAYASTGGTSDRLFLRLRWVKIGRFFFPKHVLTALENIFLKAYIESRSPSIKLLRITFSDKTMVMDFRKEGSTGANIPQQNNPLVAPEIFYPYGN